MNIDTREYGEPTIDLLGFKLWIFRYAHQLADDYYDANWLCATAACSAKGASVLVENIDILTFEIGNWKREIDLLYRKLEGSAVLECMEPGLNVRLTAGSLGAVAMTVIVDPGFETVV